MNIVLSNCRLRGVFFFLKTHQKCEFFLKKKKDIKMLLWYLKMPGNGIYLEPRKKLLFEKQSSERVKIVGK